MWLTPLVSTAFIKGIQCKWKDGTHQRGKSVNYHIWRLREKGGQRDFWNSLGKGATRNGDDGIPSMFPLQRGEVMS